MKEIKDLVYILDRFSTREINIVTNPQRKTVRNDQRYWEFYTGLREDRWKSEKESARHFGMETGSRRYNRLKNELKRRLYDTVLFLDAESSEFNEYTRKQQTLLKEWAQCAILFRRGGVTAFMELGKKCLQDAIDLDQINTVVEVARMLCIMAVARPQYHASYAEWQKILETYAPAHFAELQLEMAYNAIMTEAVRYRGYSQKTLRQLEAIVQKFSPQADQFKYINFQLYFGLLSIYSHSCKQNWVAALQTADKAIAITYTKKYISSGYISLFLNQKTVCLIMLGRHEEARQFAKENISISIRGTAQWFKSRELLVATTLHAGWYAEAWDTVKDTLRHERFGALSPLDQESWRLYSGYLHFLSRCGRFELSTREKIETAKFRLQTWLNDLPYFSKDKRGANIPLLLLQIHFLLSENKLLELEHRIDALRKYKQRNLDPDGQHFRTDLMIRLLELLIKHCYEPEILEGKAQPLLAQMKNAAPGLLNGSFEIEIVPYPQQWGWLMDALRALSPLARFKPYSEVGNR